MHQTPLRQARLKGLNLNTYVCPRCQIGLRKYPLTNTPRRTLIHSLSTTSSQTSTLPDGLFPKSKTFSTSSGGRAETELQSDRSRERDAVEDDFPRFHISRWKDQLSGQSPIRDQLRAWSLQNEKTKIEDGPGELETAQRGYFTAVPQSLFLNEVEDMEEDDEADDNDPDVDKYTITAANLVPGDILHIKLRNCRRQFAVFLGMTDTQCQFLLADGRWCVDSTKLGWSLILHNFATGEEMDAIRKFMPKKSLQRLSMIGLTEPLALSGEVPSNISTPIINKIRQLEDDIAAFHRLHVNTLDHLYEAVSHDKNYNSLKFTDLVERFFGRKHSDMSHGALFSISVALHQEPAKMQTYGNLAEEMYVTTTPKRLVAQFEKVTAWARDFQECSAQLAVKKNVYPLLNKNPLQEFAVKARKLIMKSREIRKPTTIGVLGPTTNRSGQDHGVVIQDTGVEYSENDKMILEFLWNTYLRLPISNSTPHHAIGSMILRAVGGYPAIRLERNIGRLLLQELGSLAPWSEYMDDSISMPIPGRRGAHVADKLHEESEKVLRELRPRDASQQIHMNDTMAHLRKDWGDMVVLVIDSPGSIILDDGISLEPYLQIPGAYWVHVHISHPSAFISPDHPFAKQARHSAQTLYTALEAYHMLPEEFARSLSVGLQSPVLTTSSLIMPDGEVTEVKVSAGRVNNVTRLDPRAVDIILGRAERKKSVISLGPDAHPTEPPDQPALDAAFKHSEMLRTIERLSQARLTHRRQQVPEYANWKMFPFDLQSKVSFLEPHDANRISRSYHYLGDPSICSTADHFGGPMKVSDMQARENVVTHVMQLAGESAARWLRDRGIPAVFSGSAVHQEFPISRLNNLKPNEPSFPPMAKLSSSPIPHPVMSMSQYCRVTSPLRRYPDLLCQWQVDAVLKAEAASPNNSVLSGKDIELPFTTQMVEDCIALQPQIRGIEDLARLSDTHWATQALFRAFHFNQAPLPEHWDFLVQGITHTAESEDSNLRGRLYPFGFFTALLKSPEGWENSVMFNQFLPVKVVLVDICLNKVYVKAVGPPSDTLTQRYPLEINSPIETKSSSEAKSSSAPRPRHR